MKPTIKTSYTMKRRNLLHLCGLLASIAFTAETAEAKVDMPSIFSDGMVLQQQSRVPVWGSCDRKKQDVTLTTSWDGKSYRSATDNDGRWRVTIDTPSFGGPYAITVDDGETTSIDNVMIGEVWLCSGQSNMDMRVSGRYNDPVIGSLEAVVTSDNPDIRMFTVGANLTSELQSDCTGNWEEASTATVPEFSATAYFFARRLNEVLGMPVGIIHSSYGGSRVEAWMSTQGIADFKENPDVHNECILYNGMIAPVAGYGIRGCLWYQGEANIDAPDLYMDLFPAMAADWRRQWNAGEFPIYYAQIAPFAYNKGEGKGRNSAYLREAQLKCLELIPSSGMIILTDVGDARTIHPMEKKTVGDRFAYMALSQTYGKKGFPATGPTYKSMQIDGDKIEIEFDNIGNGLTSYRRPLTGFEIAGEDRVFVPADARFGKDSRTIIVSGKDVEHPVAVRYAFKDYVDGSLFNMWGLPASSFRTDNW